MIYAVYDEATQADFGFVKGLIPSLVCIIIVFLVLALLAFILSMINRIKALDVKPTSAAANKPSMARQEVDFEALDDDAKAAVLAATIDFREECKTDVELLSVKEI